MNTDPSRSRSRLAALAFVSLFVAVGSASRAQSLSAAQWRSDLAILDESLRTIHPRPFFRVAESEFEAAVGDLQEAIPELGERRIVARFLELVAMLEDGHTRIEPSGPHGFRTWLPVRFHGFTDGLFITVCDRRLESLVGAEVVRIGALEAGEALARAERLVSADNRFWRRCNAAMFLSNVDALLALGVLEPGDAPSITVRSPTGEEATVPLPALRSDFSDSWFWRALGSPPGTQSTHAFEGASPHHLREQDRGDQVYWFEYLEEARVLYFQFNGWWDAEGESFHEFRERLWSTYDGAEVRSLVIDLRYNAGGDGSMFKPMLHEIIRRPELLEPDRLVVLVGPRTFSASILALADLREHTRATLVGEPPGSGLNMCGDAVTIVLPNSELSVNISALYWQKGFPADQRRVVSPHLPATFSSEDFFAGRDPALELVLQERAVSIPALLLRQGGSAAREEHDRLRERHAELAWWRPFAERPMNSLGYELLRDGRIDDARVAFELNTEVYPDSSNTWDSLGESFVVAGHPKRAAEAYRRAVEIDPGNENAARQLRGLEERIHTEEGGNR